MGAESAEPPIIPTGAVFLSYASQDADAARRICDALREAGIEVWFDQTELRGGDAWDRNIRKQIHDCMLFMPLISQHSQERLEGYFRLEWKLAVDRSHRMATERSFIVPVVVDSTRERDALVPDAFRDVQWTHLPGGEIPPAFIERVRQLLSAGQPEKLAKILPSADSTAVAVSVAGSRAHALRRRAVLFSIGAVALAALGYVVFEQLVRSKSPLPVAATPKSIAVLPLANESGDASQQYFSDGLSEDLITALSQFPGLKVIGRTSSFKFRDSKDDSQTIGAKLGVARLLEGSVRHAGDMVRVSAELIDTSDGSTQWSERYDRPYKDLFALQDDITRAVAGALRVRLVQGDRSAALSDHPPTGNLEAYNAVLEGKFYFRRDTEADLRKAIEQFTHATQLDSRYALAWSLGAQAWAYLGYNYLETEAELEAFSKGRLAADTALALAPDLASAHIARGWVLNYGDFDWRGAEAEYRKALELAPGDGDAKDRLGDVLGTLGQMEKAIDLTREALVTDPLRASYYEQLAYLLWGFNRPEEAERAIRRAIELLPNATHYHFTLTRIETLRGNPQAALAAAHQEPAGSFQDAALALAHQIGDDHAAADVALKLLLDRYPDFFAYTLAEMYAIRNEPNQSFLWLDRALRTHDAGIGYLLYDPFLTRYKNDPRFATFCRKVGLLTSGS